MLPNTSRSSQRPARGLQLLRLEERIAPTVVPVGGEFQVNTITTGSQLEATVALDQAGNFVVAWESAGGNILAQRYDSAGLPLGGEFLANTYTTNFQGQPSVAMDQAGNFVVSWFGASQFDTSSAGISAQRFDSTGQALGGELGANTYTTDAQQFQSVAMDQDGDFVIAWRSSTQDFGGSGVYAQRYNSAGVTQGGEFRVNTYSTSTQSLPSVAMDQDGNFVVAWQSFGQDGDNYGIYAQRYNSSGVPQGGEFQVNTFVTGRQWYPNVAMDQNGDFVIVWHNSTAVSSVSLGVYAQRYNSVGQPQGNEFRVDNHTNGSGGKASVALDKAGNFVVAWGFGGEVYAQAYLAGGTANGGNFRVNTYTLFDQDAATVAMNQNGDFIVAWRSNVQDGSDSGIYAQRYKLTVPPTISGIQINDGAAQRSRLASLTVTFNENVHFTGGTPANAFTLTGPNGGINVAVDLAASTATQTIATLTFTGPGTEFGSLADGNYTLTVLANQVVDSFGQQLDGNGDGTPGGDYTFNFHRLFGDADGNGTITAADFNAFRLAYETGPSIFDFNGDGQTTAADFNAFRMRYGVTIIP